MVCKKCHPIISFVALLFPASDIFLLFSMRKAKYVFQKQKKVIESPSQLFSLRPFVECYNISTRFQTTFRPKLCLLKCNTNSDMQLFPLYTLSPNKEHPPVIEIMYHYRGQKTKSLVEFIINFYWVIIQIPITLGRYIFMFKIMG